jgi:catechol 2,3-dioxygenase-like lactoylglutathione lyase family enzyme
MPVRPLDHLVLPVTDIATARARLTRLGFTVAADARHPFGTENACVFFADKTYLEPLGVADEEEVSVSAKSGNQFVARDAAFRFRNGPEGLSAIVMGTDDADADHAAFKAEGISAGGQLAFSRVMKFPDGSEITASFKLSFAADLRAPDFFAFTCERINMPPSDRSALEKHANGVIGVRTVVLCEQEPRDFSFYLQAVTGQENVADDLDVLVVKTANTDIMVFDPLELRLLFGLSMSSERGLRGEAVVFKVSDLAVIERLLVEGGILHLKSRSMIVVPHAPGQGVLFAFSE